MLELFQIIFQNLDLLNKFLTLIINEITIFPVVCSLFRNAIYNTEIYYQEQFYYTFCHKQPFVGLFLAGKYNLIRTILYFREKMMYPAFCWQPVLWGAAYASRENFANNFVKQEPLLTVCYKEQISFWTNIGKQIYQIPTENNVHRGFLMIYTKDFLDYIDVLNPKLPQFRFQRCHRDLLDVKYDMSQTFPQVMTKEERNMCILVYMMILSYLSCLYPRIRFISPQHFLLEICDLLHLEKFSTILKNTLNVDPTTRKLFVDAMDHLGCQTTNIYNCFLPFTSNHQKLIQKLSKFE